MNKYRKEYCEENGTVSINPENTALYDYIKHLENKLEETEQLRSCGVLKPLKDKEVLTFNEWIKFNKYTRFEDTDFYKQGGMLFNRKDIEGIYKVYLEDPLML